MQGNADRFSQNKLKKYFGLFDDGLEMMGPGVGTESGGVMRGVGMWEGIVSLLRCPFMLAEVRDVASVLVMFLLEGTHSVVVLTGSPSLALTADTSCTPFDCVEEEEEEEEGGGGNSPAVVCGAVLDTVA